LVQSVYADVSSSSIVGPTIELDLGKEFKVREGEKKIRFALIK
jgi:hypothetical protein